MMSDLHIGHTPLVHLLRLEETLQLKNHLYAKLELCNPFGSVKDRTASYLLNALPSPVNAQIRPQIVCATSGNTGIALAALASRRQIQAHIVMPENASQERVQLIRAYGGQVHATPAGAGMSGATAKAEKLCIQLPNAHMIDQFAMKENAQAHFETTGPEIADAFSCPIDCFIAGVGTGGTFTGTVRYLKQRFSSLCAIAVEPEDSAVLSGDRPCEHRLAGIGAGFIPPLWDHALCDHIFCATYDDAQKAALLLLATEQIFVGPSSAAALHAAIQTAKSSPKCGMTMVVLFPDSGERYLSTGWPIQ